MFTAGAVAIDPGDMRGWQQLRQCLLKPLRAMPCWVQIRIAATWALLWHSLLMPTMMAT